MSSSRSSQEVRNRTENTNLGVSDVDGLSIAGGGDVTANITDGGAIQGVIDLTRDVIARQVEASRAQFGESLAVSRQNFDQAMTFAQGAAQPGGAQTIEKAVIAGSVVVVVLALVYFQSMKKGKR